MNITFITALTILAQLAILCSDNPNYFPELYPPSRDTNVVFHPFQTWARRNTIFAANEEPRRITAARRRRRRGRPGRLLARARGRRRREMIVIVMHHP